MLLPTYWSWLNWFEPEFAALRYDALNSTDHRSHAEQNAAISAYVRDRDRRTRPKTDPLGPEFTDPELDELPGQGRVARH